MPYYDPSQQFLLGAKVIIKLVYNPCTIFSKVIEIIFFILILCSLLMTKGTDFTFFFWSGMFCGKLHDFFGQKLPSEFHLFLFEMYPQ